MKFWERRATPKSHFTKLYSNEKPPTSHSVFVCGFTRVEEFTLPQRFDGASLPEERASVPAHIVTAARRVVAGFNTLVQVSFLVSVSCFTSEGKAEKLRLRCTNSTATSPNRFRSL
jgi:hypothetical protein